MSKKKRDGRGGYAGAKPASPAVQGNLVDGLYPRVDLLGGAGGNVSGDGCLYAIAILGFCLVSLLLGFVEGCLKSQ